MDYPLEVCAKAHKALVAAQASIKQKLALDGETQGKGAFRYPSPENVLTIGRNALNEHGFSLGAGKVTNIRREGDVEKGLWIMTVGANLDHESGWSREYGVDLPIMPWTSSTGTQNMRQAALTTLTSARKYLMMDVLCLRGPEDDEKPGNGEAAREAPKASKPVASPAPRAAAPTPAATAPHAEMVGHLATGLAEAEVRKESPTSGGAPRSTGASPPPAAAPAAPPTSSPATPTLSSTPNVTSDKNLGSRYVSLLAEMKAARLASGWTNLLAWSEQLNAWAGSKVVFAGTGFDQKLVTAAVLDGIERGFRAWVAGGKRVPVAT